MNVHLSYWYDLTHISLLHPYNAIVYVLWGITFSADAVYQTLLILFRHIYARHLYVKIVCSSFYKRPFGVGQSITNIKRETYGVSGAYSRSSTKSNVFDFRMRC